MTFSYQSYPTKVVFGKKLLEALAQEIAGGAHTTLGVIASTRHSARVKDIGKVLGVKAVTHFDKIEQHVPESLVHEAERWYHETHYDLLLAIGGGSAIGLGKALTQRTGATLWAAPTTFSGSELTHIYGVSAGDKKIVDRDLQVLPKKVFYDSDLFVELPLPFAVRSAVNALAHLVEALYSADGNPITRQHAVMGMRFLWQGLKELAFHGMLSQPINEKLMLGALLGGKCLNESKMALQHKAAHVLGGSYGMDHSSVHTVLLPYVLAYQWDFLDAQTRKSLIEIFDSDYPPTTIKLLSESLDASATLNDIGFKGADLHSAAVSISKLSFANPAPVTQEKVAAMLKRAFDGELG